MAGGALQRTVLRGLLAVLIRVGPARLVAAGTVVAVVAGHRGPAAEQVGTVAGHAVLGAGRPDHGPVLALVAPAGQGIDAAEGRAAETGHLQPQNIVGRRQQRLLATAPLDVTGEDLAGVIRGSMELPPGTKPSFIAVRGREFEFYADVRDDGTFVIDVNVGPGAQRGRGQHHGLLFGEDMLLHQRADVQRRGAAECDERVLRGVRALLDREIVGGEGSDTAFGGIGADVIRGGASTLYGTDAIAGARTARPMRADDCTASGILVLRIMPTRVRSMSGPPRRATDRRYEPSGSSRRVARGVGGISL